MKAAKLKFFAALVFLTLSGSASAMLPVMMLLMAPMMGMDGMTHNPEGHGDSAREITRTGEHLHSSADREERNESLPSGGGHHKDTLTDTAGSLGTANEVEQNR